MREYLFAPEVVRVTIVLGVVVSMLFYEQLQLTTGGAIVPAYLALALPHPGLVVVTLLAGTGTWAVVHRWLPRHRILYGRRKFEVEVLVGLGLLMVGTLTGLTLGDQVPGAAALTGVGYLVPGIIAHDMGRQGPTRTAWAILANVAVLFCAVYVCVQVLRLVRAEPRGEVTLLAGTLAYPRQLIIVAAAASVLVGMVLFSRLGLRSGGFITAAYLALVAPRWPDLVFVAACALLTWAVVVHGLMPRLLLFGRRKLATMVLVAALVTWAAEVVAIEVSDGAYVPWRGLTVVTLMVPALLANDAQRQGWTRTVAGSALGTLGVLGTVSLVAAGSVATGLLR